MSDHKLAAEFQGWSSSPPFAGAGLPPETPGLRDVVRWLNEHDYRVVKLTAIADPLEADMAAWDGDGFKIEEEL